MEYVRAHLLTGFPWYYLGHSQYRFLALIQVADITGALGVSFLIALVNAWVRRPALPAPAPARHPRAAADLPADGPALDRRRCWSGGRLGLRGLSALDGRFRDGPRLALLQTNLEQRYKMGGRARW